MKACLAVAIAALLLSGCVTQKNWFASGGSRADATVRLSYQYGSFEVPQVDEAEAISLATARCQAWGYRGAEAFGGGVQQCTVGDGLGGCGTWTVTREFQCLGTGHD